MADSLHKLISEARKNKFSLIPSLSEDGTCVHDMFAVHCSNLLV